MTNVLLLIAAVEMSDQNRLSASRWLEIKKERGSSSFQEIHSSNSKWLDARL